MIKKEPILFMVSLLLLLTIVSLKVSGDELDIEKDQQEIKKEKAELHELLIKENELQQLIDIEESHHDEELAEVDELLFALNDNFDMPSPDKRDSFGRDRERKRKHLDQLRLLKLLEILDLREDQEMEFLTAFNEARREQRRIERELRRTISELSDILRENEGSEEAIVPKIEHIIEIERAKTELRSGFLERIHEFLSPVQLGRFVIFQERFEADLLEQVRGFQGRQRKPGR